MTILRGDKLAKKINSKTKLDVKKLKTRPCLAAILVGSNTASKLYISIKKRTAKKLGIKFIEYKLSTNVREKKILEIIKLLNKDNSVNGIMVQLPLPKKFNSTKIIQSISPIKDVDGFHKKNIKKTNNDAILSPLIGAIIELIKSTKQNLKNKEVLIIAKNRIFYKTINTLLHNIKVSTKKINHIIKINKHSRNCQNKILKADIIIIAIGKPKSLKLEMVKHGSTIIDVGINKFNGKTVGDADFQEIKKTSRFITPVPGGFGPMTVAMLMKNVVKLTKKQLTDI